MKKTHCHLSHRPNTTHCPLIVTFGVTIPLHIKKNSRVEEEIIQREDNDYKIFVFNSLQRAF